MSAGSVFLAKKWPFPDQFFSSKIFSVDTSSTGNKKRTFPVVPRASSQKRSIRYRLHHFGHMRAIYKNFHHGNGEAAAPARPRYLKSKFLGA